MLGYLNNCVGGDPACNAYYESVKGLLGKRLNSRLYLGLLVVVGNGVNGNEIKSLRLKRILCCLTLSDDYVNGGINLTEAYKTYFCHNISSFQGLRILSYERYLS